MWCNISSTDLIVFGLSFDNLTIPSSREASNSTLSSGCISGRAIAVQTALHRLKFSFRSGRLRSFRITTTGGGDVKRNSICWSGSKLTLSGISASSLRCATISLLNTCERFPMREQRVPEPRPVRKSHARLARCPLCRVPGIARHQYRRCSGYPSTDLRKGRGELATRHRWRAGFFPSRVFYPPHSRHKVRAW